MEPSTIFNSEFFEMCFLLCFAAAWPVSIYKSIKARTAKGKSIVFEWLIVLGYSFGIAAKLTADSLSYVLLFYILNITMVAIDIALYYRNAHLDKLREAGA